MAFPIPGENSNPSFAVVSNHFPGALVTCCLANHVKHATSPMLINQLHYTGTCFHLSCENKNPLTKVKGQYHQAVSDSLVWVWACGYSIGLDHQDIGFSKAFNGYSNTGFQKDKKKLTDIGFIGPDNYRVVFV